MSEQEEWDEAFWDYVGWEFPLTAGDDEEAWTFGQFQPLEIAFPEDFGHFYGIE